MSPSIGSLPPKYRVTVDPDQCMLCGRCVENCAYGAFRLDGDRYSCLEINTIPGFTPISMYPKLWEASGLPYDALIDELIRFAMQRQNEKDQIIRKYSL